MHDRGLLFDLLARYIITVEKHMSAELDHLNAAVANAQAALAVQAATLADQAAQIADLQAASANAIDPASVEAAAVALDQAVAAVTPAPAG